MDKNNKIALQAQKFRVNNGLGLGESINLRSLLRKLNIMTVYLPMSENAYGLSLIHPKGFRFILVNSNCSKGRQHFTIAHELYHLFYDENPHPHICGRDGSSRTERYADRFASALLMPLEGIVALLSDEEYSQKKISIAQVLRLEQYFRVSRSSMLIRLRELGLISAGKYDSLKTYPVKRSVEEYGYDYSLYRGTGERTFIGDYGEKARLLFEQEKISEGHYVELLNLVQNGGSKNCIGC